MRFPDGFERSIVQIEIAIDPEELTKHGPKLSEIATILSHVSSSVIPVVTNYQYKLGVDELEGPASSFRGMLMRAIGPDRSRDLEVGIQLFEDKVGISEKTGLDRINIPLARSEAGLEPVSGLIVTVVTRDSFVNRYDRLDTEGLDARIKAHSGNQSWIIVVLDATEGIFVTRSNTEKIVDTVLEGQAGRYLATSIDGDIDPIGTEIVVISDLGMFQDHLTSRGFLDPVVEIDSPEAQKKRSESDLDRTLEMLEIFRDSDLPDIDSLDDFWGWVCKQGSYQSHYKEFLKGIEEQLVAARCADNQSEREEMVSEIHRSLIDAVIHGMEKRLRDNAHA